MWFCRSNELFQTLTFFNQPVSSEKVDICQEMIWLLFRNQEGRVFNLWLAICFCCCQEVLLLRNYVFFLTVFEHKWLLIDIFWILENWYTCTMEWLFCSRRRWIVIYVIYNNQIKKTFSMTVDRLSFLFYILLKVAYCLLYF